MIARSLFNEHGKSSNFLGILTWSVLGKQNRQAKQVFLRELNCFLLKSWHGKVFFSCVCKLPPPPPPQKKGETKQNLCNWSRMVSGLFGVMETTKSCDWEVASFLSFSTCSELMRKQPGEVNLRKLNARWTTKLRNWKMTWMQRKVPEQRLRNSAGN